MIRFKVHFTAQNSKDVNTLIRGKQILMKRRRNDPAGSVCEMVDLVKENQQVDFGRRYCRYISEHIDKYIILILANLRIVRNVIRNFREKTIWRDITNINI